VVLDDLLSGLDTKVMEIIKEHLPSINETLYRFSESHHDEICRIHAENALATLSGIVERLVEGDVKAPRVVELVKFL
jgi:hypothetical protein